MHENGDGKSDLFTLYNTYCQNLTDLSDESEVESEDDLNISNFIKPRITSANYSTIEEVMQKRKSHVQEKANENIELPFNITEGSQENLLEIINGLSKELEERESTYPKLIAAKLSEKFEKEIKNFKNFGNFEVDMPNVSERKVFYEKILFDKMNEIQTKLDKISTLMRDLQLVKQYVKN